MHVFTPNFMTLKQNSAMPDKYRLKNLFEEVSKPSTPVTKTINVRKKSRRQFIDQQAKNSYFIEIRSKSALERGSKPVSDNRFDYSATRIPACHEVKLIHSKKINQEQLRRNVKSRTEQRTDLMKDGILMGNETCKIRPFLVTKTIMYHEREESHPHSEAIRTVKTTGSKERSIHGVSGVRIRFKKVLQPQQVQYRPWSPTKNLQDQQWMT